MCEHMDLFDFLFLSLWIIRLTILPLIRLGTNMPQEPNWMRSRWSLLPRSFSSLCSLLVSFFSFSYCVQIHPIQSHFHRLILLLRLIRYVCVHFFPVLRFIFFFLCIRCRHLSLFFTCSPCRFPSVCFDCVRRTIVIICPFKLQRKRLCVRWFFLLILSLSLVRMCIILSKRSSERFFKTLLHLYKLFRLSVLLLLLLLTLVVRMTVLLFFETFTQTLATRILYVIRMQKTSITMILA